MGERVTAQGIDRPIHPVKVRVEAMNDDRQWLISSESSCRKADGEVVGGELYRISEGILCC